MSPKIRLRVLLLVFLALAFAVTQDRYLMRRLLRHGAPEGTVHWQTSLDAATVQAAREKKPLFVDFSATWCGPCQDMLQGTYRDPDVAKVLNERFVPVLIDIDKDPTIAARFGVSPIPDQMFIAPDGKRQLLRTIGYHSSDTFLDMTDQALQAEAKLPPLPVENAKFPSSGTPTPAAPLPPLFGLP